MCLHFETFDFEGITELPTFFCLHVPALLESKSRERGKYYFRSAADETVMQLAVRLCSAGCRPALARQQFIHKIVCVTIGTVVMSRHTQH
jgi:hypothetical protein